MTRSASDRTRLAADAGRKMAVEDAIGCMSIPELRSMQSRLVGRIVQGVIGGRDDPGRVGAGNYVSALLDGDWPLSVFAQGNTGNTQHRRLFLNPAGVRQHQTRAAEEFQKIEIAERISQAQAVGAYSSLQTQFGDHF